MADTSVATGLTVEQWDDKYFREYIQEMPFKGESGTGENNIIQVKEDLMSKKGSTVHYALLNRLTGAGVTGTSTLEGNEEALDTRSQAVSVIKRRNAVRVPEQDEQYSAVSLREAAKVGLKDWSIENTRDRILTAMHSINGVAYGSASEANKDAWLVDNADRVLFGAAISNNSSNDHSASLANIDNTNDQLTSSAASLMKRIALTASPKIRPVRVKGMNRRYYCAYVHPLVMRDLKTDTVITAAQREVSVREQNNKLFEGGDIVWDGIIFKEVDDMPLLAGVGAAGIQVSPVFFCGAQAVAHAINRRWYSTEEVFDYGDKHGCAINAFDGFEKLRFGTGSGDTDDLKDHGMVTGYFAAVADS